jgi:hypothetical protein
VFDFQSLAPLFQTKTSTMYDKIIDAAIPFYPEF